MSIETRPATPKEVRDWLVAQQCDCGDTRVAPHNAIRFTWKKTPPGMLSFFRRTHQPREYILTILNDAHLDGGRHWMLEIPEGELPEARHLASLLSEHFRAVIRIRTVAMS